MGTHNPIPILVGLFSEPALRLSKAEVSVLCHQARALFLPLRTKPYILTERIHRRSDSAVWRPNYFRPLLKTLAAPLT